MSQVIYTAEIVAYDPNRVAARTYYFATKGFTSESTDTPSKTHFDGRLMQPLAIERFLFANGTTKGRSQTGYGEIILTNGDGEDFDQGGLDRWIDLNVEGRTITIRRGTLGGAYPSSFTTVFVGPMAGLELTQEDLRIRLRDAQADVNVPFQTTKYTGSGTLEGTSDDLKGKPKPFCIGQVFNVAPPCVNTEKLIYQVHDNTVASVDMVYDRGVELTTGLKTFTNRSAAAAFVGVHYANGVFVAVGGTDGVSSAIYTSTDGTTWTSRTTSFGTSRIEKVVYGGGTWVAVGYSGKVATSTDNGVTWTQRTTASFAAEQVRDVAYGRGVFVIVGGTGTARINTSTDGITWTARTPSTMTTQCDGVAYGNGVFAVSGPTGQIISSSDGGATWTGPHATSTAIFGAAQVNTVAWGRDRFIAGSADAEVAVSFDGVSWTLTGVSGFDTTTIAGATHGLGYYIIVGGSSKVSVSRDGLDWVLQITGFGGSVQDVATGAGSIIIVGTAGISQCRVVTTYASQAAIEDDAQAPERGTFGYYAAGGLIRLGSAPDGLITCDVTEGSAASDRTVAQCYKRLLQRAGYVAGEWNATDLTTLDAADDAVIGYWTDQETTYAAVFDQIAESLGASWFVDSTGVFRIRQLLLPSSGAEVASFREHDMVKPLERLASNDPGRGIPTYQTIVRYAKNYAVQTSDVAAGATEAQRAFVSKLWREVSASDSNVQTEYLNAIQSVDDSLLATESDAQTEATRRQALRGTARFLFEFGLQINDDTVDLDIGDVLKIGHPRFGLSVVGDEANHTYDSLVVILGLKVDARARRMTVTAWGPKTLASNRVTQDGYYRVTRDGSYRRVAA